MAKEALVIQITADNKAAIAGITQVKNTVDGLTESIKVYQDKAFAEKDITKLKVYNREIQALQAQLKQTTNVGKVGFDEMGVKIEGGTNALSKSFGALRQIAYIVPGIGIAGIFNLAFEAIGKAADELGLFAKKEDEAAKAAAEFNKELLKQREGATEEISHMKALADVASNASLSTKKRLQAVKELRDQYPAYFKDLSNEQILTGDITKATDLLTDAIYKRAEARAREAEIAKKATQVFENQQKLELIDFEIAKQKKLASDRSVLQKVGTSGGINDISGADIQYQSEQKLRDLQVQRNILSLQTEGIKIEIEKSQHRLNSLTADTIDLDIKEDKVKKEKLKTLKEYHKLVGSIREPILQERTKKEEKDMLGLAPTHINDKEADLKRGSILGANENDKKAKDMEAFAKGALKAANSLGDAFTQAITKGENLGEVLTNVFKDIATQIAAAAVKALIFQAILGIATGGTSTAAAAGGAAAGGGGFMDLFKGLLGFASGGTVSGPTSGYPVMLHGTEHIVRPDQMNKIIGGAAQMGANTGVESGSAGGEFRLSGTDLILAIQRSGFALNVRR